MATIASMAVKLIADPSDVAKGVVAAKGHIQNFASHVNKVLSGLPLVGGAFGAVPTTLAAFTNTITENIKELASMKRQADKLGLSFASYGSIVTMAGGDSELMERALFKMASTLGALNAGSDEAIKKFTALGFSAGEFKGLSMDQALAKVMDKMKGLSSFTEKAYLAQELMGRGAVTLVPALSKGSAGLEEAARKAKEFGLTLNQSEAAGIQRAALAMKDIQRSVKGLQRNLAVEFAPIVAYVSESFSAWVKNSGGMKNAFQGMAQATGRVLADMAETFDKIIGKTEKLVHEVERLVKLYNGDWIGQNVSAGEMFGGGGAMMPQDRAIQRFLGNLRRGAAGIGTGAKKSPLQELADRLRKMGDYFNVTAKAANSAGENLPDQRLIMLRQKVDELTMSLAAQVEAYGKNSQQVALNKLAMEGATQAQLKAAQARINELESLEKIASRATATLNFYEDWIEKTKQLEAAFRAGKISREGFEGGKAKLADALANSEQAKAAELFRETRTETEKLMADFSLLDGMLARGKIDKELHARGVGKLMRAFMDAHKAQELRMSGAMEFGSQETYKIIHQNMLKSGGNKTGFEAFKEFFKQQLETEKNQLKEAREFNRHARKGFIAVGKI